MPGEPRDLDARVAAIEEALARAAAGDFDHSVAIDSEGEPDYLSSVEYGVNLMLRDVADLHREQVEKTRQLEETLELVRSQRAAIAELSTPVLQLWDDVLAMPIIGAVDTRRSVDITARLLEEIAARQARYVILDITGVDIMDTSTADHFLKLVHAARLLGAECVLSGIRPPVAQTLVAIGVDLSTISTKATLQTALDHCLKRMRAGT
jgi:rsbT co-antagonist protein RsbR